MTTGACQIDHDDNCVAPALIAVGAALGTGAIIGIVIAIVVAVACLGGGAYAATQAMNTSSAAPVTNNPLYRGVGTGGSNPLNRQH